MSWGSVGAATSPVIPTGPQIYTINVRNTFNFTNAGVVFSSPCWPDTGDNSDYTRILNNPSLVAVGDTIIFNLLSSNAYPCSAALVLNGGGSGGFGFISSSGSNSYTFQASDLGKTYLINTYQNNPTQFFSPPTIANPVMNIQASPGATIPIAKQTATGVSYILDFTNLNSANNTVGLSSTGAALQALLGSPTFLNVGDSVTFIAYGFEYYQFNIFLQGTATGSTPKALLTTSSACISNPGTCYATTSSTYTFTASDLNAAYVLTANFTVLPSKSTGLSSSQLSQINQFNQYTLYIQNSGNRIIQAAPTTTVTVTAASPSAIATPGPWGAPSSAVTPSGPQTYTINIRNTFKFTVGSSSGTTIVSTGCWPDYSDTSDFSRILNNANLVAVGDTIVFNVHSDNGYPCVGSIVAQPQGSNGGFGFQSLNGSSSYTFQASDSGKSFLLNAAGYISNGVNNPYTIANPVMHIQASPGLTNPLAKVTATGVSYLFDFTALNFVANTVGLPSTGGAIQALQSPKFLNVGDTVTFVAFGYQYYEYSISLQSPNLTPKALLATPISCITTSACYSTSSSSYTFLPSDANVVYVLSINFYPLVLDTLGSAQILQIEQSNQYTLTIQPSHLPTGTGVSTPASTFTGYVTITDTFTTSTTVVQVVSSTVSLFSTTSVTVASVATTTQTTGTTITSTQTIPTAITSTQTFGASVTTTQTFESDITTASTATSTSSITTTAYFESDVTTTQTFGAAITTTQTFETDITTTQTFGASVTTTQTFESDVTTTSTYSTQVTSTQILTDVLVSTATFTASTTPTTKTFTSSITSTSTIPTSVISTIHSTTTSLFTSVKTATLLTTLVNTLLTTTTKSLITSVTSIITIPTTKISTILLSSTSTIPVSVTKTSTLLTSVTSSITKTSTILASLTSTSTVSKTSTTIVTATTASITTLSVTIPTTLVSVSTVPQTIDVTLLQTVFSTIPAPPASTITTTSTVISTTTQTVIVTACPSPISATFSIAGPPQFLQYFSSVTSIQGSVTKDNTHVTLVINGNLQSPIVAGASLRIPYSGGFDDSPLCPYIAGGCPVAAGGSVSLSLTFPLPSPYPLLGPGNPSTTISIYLNNGGNTAPAGLTGEITDLNFADTTQFTFCG